MPKTFEIMYLPAEGPTAAHGQWYADVLQRQGWSGRLSQRKVSRSEIALGSTVGNILASVYPGIKFEQLKSEEQPPTWKQPAFLILTREIAAPKKDKAAKPAGAAGAAGAAGVSHGANATINALAGRLGAVDLVTEIRRQGVGAFTQQPVVYEGSQEDVANELAKQMAGLGVGGKRKTRRGRRTTTRRRRYSKRS